MSWTEFHRQSEMLAAEAHEALLEGRHDRALSLFAEAAAAEQRALFELDRAKPRTLGITAIGAVALWYKANDFVRVEQLARQGLKSAQCRRLRAVRFKPFYIPSSSVARKRSFLPPDH
jgi:hypothetical protein